MNQDHIWCVAFLYHRSGQKDGVLQRDSVISKTVISDSQYAIR